MAWADLQLFTCVDRVNRKYKEIQHSYTAWGGRETESFLFLFFPGTDKILLTSEVIFMLVQSAANSLNPDMLY